ncbi:MAG: heavy metal translocating P-type ATPase [Desulfobacteraceae bacterium]
MADRTGDTSQHERIGCYQCGLPVTRSSRCYEIDGVSAYFCCTGCYLVQKLTGTSGEEGISQILLGKFGLGLALSMNVLFMSMPLHIEAASSSTIVVPASFAVGLKYLLLFFSIPIMLVLGIPIAKSSIDSLRAGEVGTEALILIGAVAAFAISVKSTLAGVGEVYFETATMILTLFTLGRYIDSKAKWRASESIKGLSSLVPSQVVRILPDGDKENVQAEDIAIGDKVLLRPGERIPLDGTVVTGQGLVDESFLSGESKPVMKKEEMEVFAGSINLDGTLILEIRKPAEEFLVKKIEKLMEKIRANPSSINRISDRLAAWFLPLIVTIGLTVFSYWTYKGEPSIGIMRMLAILLISCPCAFGIAAPMAIWRGLGLAAQKGAIIMGADILEGLAKVKTVFFDKTGTLTTDTPAITEIIAGAGWKEDELLAIAAALDAHSTHPLAKSLVEEADRRGLRPLETLKVKSVPGSGIEGLVNGRQYHLGSMRWLSSLSEEKDLDLLKREAPKGESSGMIFMLADGKAAGAFIFSQALRDGADDAVETIKKMGVRTVILTGDDEKGALGIKDMLKPDKIKWRLFPADKAKEIRAEEKKKITAMVGDGVNDAPALEAAHIGIAMGCGTALTRESAKVNLLGDDLRMIPFLINLSRKVRRKVMVNFIWAFSYNLIGTFLAVTGVITPLFAVMAMILSSLMVIGNALRGY